MKSDSVKAFRLIGSADKFAIRGMAHCHYPSNEVLAADRANWVRRRLEALQGLRGPPMKPMKLTTEIRNPRIIDPKATRTDTACDRSVEIVPVESR
jgi:hypothetical protein